MKDRDCCVQPETREYFVLGRFGVEQVRETYGPSGNRPRIEAIMFDRFNNPTNTSGMATDLIEGVTGRVIAGPDNPFAENTISRLFDRRLQEE